MNKLGKKTHLFLAISTLLISILVLISCQSTIEPYEISSSSKKQMALVFPANTLDDKKVLLSQDFYSNKSRMLMEIKPIFPSKTILENIDKDFEKCDLTKDAKSEFLAISPDQRYVMTYTQTYVTLTSSLTAKKGELENATVYLFNLTDRLENKTIYLGYLINKIFKDLVSKGKAGQLSGSYYMPVYWGKDELLIIKTEIKDDPVFDLEHIAKIEKSTAKTNTECISISLPSFKITKSSKVKILSPWIQQTDTRLGFIIWRNPQIGSTNLKQRFESNIFLDSPIISDLKGDHVWNIKDEINKIWDINIYTQSSIYLVSSFKQKSSTMLFFILFTQSKDYPRKEFLFNLDNGEITTLKEYSRDDLNNTDNFLSCGILMSNLQEREKISMLSYVYQKQSKDLIWFSEFSNRNIKPLFQISREGYNKQGEMRVFITEAQIN